MNITVIGTGYVGLVTGTCFAEMGNIVSCVDINEQKIENLKKGIVPIFEPGLSPMVLKNIEKNNLLFSTSLKDSIQDATIVFIAVGTPIGEDGSADLQYVKTVAKEIGQSMTKKLLVVDKSTVPVGTADQVKETIQKELDTRNSDLEFDVVSNPEFLKEGDAISDFMKPDRVVIGAETVEAMDIMKQLYSPFFRTHDRFITMDVRSAEMTKYAANAMLATKISFMNEIANICEKVGADANKVRIGIGSDSRIGYSFIYPGAGYGGSCFPKDLKALTKIAKEHNYNAKLITSVEEVNDAQKLVIFQKIVNRFGENLAGFTFGIWGLAFKPGTDDMREAPSRALIEAVWACGGKVQAYDPEAMSACAAIYGHRDDMIYADVKEDALNNAACLVICTEWKMFWSPDFEDIKSRLSSPVIVDGRNLYNPAHMADIGIEYYGIGLGLSVKKTHE